MKLYYKRPIKTVIIYGDENVILQQYKESYS
jgi:hypothetical protein